MKKNNLCPYNDKIICDYREHDSKGRYYCAECPHYRGIVPDPEEETIEPDEKYFNIFEPIISIGAVICVLILGGVFLFVLAKFINWIHP